MASARPLSFPRLSARPAPAVPAARLVVGKPVEDAAELLPRLFNLCRAAQGTAARLALGLQLAEGWQETMRQEILRDHLLRLFLVWPGRLGLGAGAPPAGREHDAGAAARAVFGPAARAPATPEALAAFLCSGHGVAPVLSRIGAAFAPGEAAAALPFVTPETALTPGAVDNSVAARHAEHPALRALADRHGRGPLWRAAARLFDIAACLDGSLPAPATPAPGVALVPAARGLYAVRAKTRDGRVAAFARVTPTDHLLAPGGVLAHSLATLPAEKAGLAPLVLDILDPCSPVRLEEGNDA
ncbi:MAG: HupK protein [Pararhodobacter sp.]